MLSSRRNQTWTHRRKPVKSFIRILAFITIWPSLLVHAEAQKKPLSIDLVTREGAIVSRGISNLEWRPGGREISYIRRQGSGKSATSVLWAYDVATRKERELVGSGGETEKLNLASYQWSPKGDALLLQGGKDLWLLDIESGVRQRLTNDADQDEDATFSPAGDRVA